MKFTSPKNLAFYLILLISQSLLGSGVREVHHVSGTEAEEAADEQDWKVFVEMYAELGKHRLLPKFDPTKLKNLNNYIYSRVSIDGRAEISEDYGFFDAQLERLDFTYTADIKVFLSIKDLEALAKAFGSSVSFLKKNYKIFMFRTALSEQNIFILITHKDWNLTEEQHRLEMAIKKRQQDTVKLQDLLQSEIARRREKSEKIKLENEEQRALTAVREELSQKISEFESKLAEFRLLTEKLKLEKRQLKLSGIIKNRNLRFKREFFAKLRANAYESRVQSEIKELRNSFKESKLIQLNEQLKYCQKIKNLKSCINELEDKSNSTEAEMLHKIAFLQSKLDSLSAAYEKEKMADLIKVEIFVNVNELKEESSAEVYPDKNWILDDLKYIKEINTFYKNHDQKRTLSVKHRGDLLDRWQRMRELHGNNNKFKEDFLNEVKIFQGLNPSYIPALNASASIKAQQYVKNRMFVFGEDSLSQHIKFVKNDYLKNKDADKLERFLYEIFDEFSIINTKGQLYRDVKMGLRLLLIVIIEAEKVENANFSLVKSYLLVRNMLKNFNLENQALDAAYMSRYLVLQKDFPLSVMNLIEGEQKNTQKKIGDLLEMANLDVVVSDNKSLIYKQKEILANLQDAYYAFDPFANIKSMDLDDLVNHITRIMIRMNQNKKLKLLEYVVEPLACAMWLSFAKNTQAELGWGELIKQQKMLFLKSHSKYLKFLIVWSQFILNQPFAEKQLPVLEETLNLESSSIKPELLPSLVLHDVLISGTLIIPRYIEYLDSNEVSLKTIAEKLLRPFLFNTKQLKSSQ